MMKAFRPLFLVLGVVLMAASMVPEGGCTPAQRDAVKVLAPELERATCVFLRAGTTDGRVLEACATADELAPFLSEVLATRSTEPSTDPPPLLAFTISPPKRKVARRRCASWVPVASALDDGGGGAPDASKQTGGGDGGG